MRTWEKISVASAVIVCVSTVYANNESEIQVVLDWLSARSTADWKLALDIALIVFVIWLVQFGRRESSGELSRLYYVWPVFMTLLAVIKHA